MNDMQVFLDEIKELVQRENPTVSTTTRIELSNDTKEPPGKQKLWSAFFNTLLDRKEIKHLQLIERHWIKLVQRFAGEGGFLSQLDIKDLVERSPLALLTVERQNSFVSLLHNFHFITDKWDQESARGNEKSRHEKALKQHPDLPGQLALELSISDWQAANILRLAGYAYPSSELAMKTWVNWSGDKQSYNYRNWLLFLQDKSDHLLLLDFWFHSLSITEEKVFHSCVSESCLSCGMKENCENYDRNQNKKEWEQIKQFALSDELKQVSDEQLVKFLGKAQFSPIIQDTGLLSGHAVHFNQYFQGVLVQSENKEWIIFWKALKEYADRNSIKKRFEKGQIFKCSGEIYESLLDRLSGEQRETFYAMILDNKHRMIQLHQVSKGTLNQSLVHPREVFSPAVQLRAAAVILIHNHPSGDPEPSKQDFEITTRLVESGKTLGIQVLDHIIFGQAAYYSFVDEGKMPE